MKRREFVNFVGLGMLATSLPIAIAACKPSNETTETPSAAPEAAEPIDETPREDGFAALGTVADLDAQGYLSKRSFIAGPVIVIRDPANADSLIALNSMCTHQGCAVEWEDDAFSCPCHGSTFSADGSVTNGPATEPLSPYEVIIDEDLVLIKAV